jgi:hypothetical protein
MNHSLTLNLISLSSSLKGYEEGFLTSKKFFSQLNSSKLMLLFASCSHSAEVFHYLSLPIMEASPKLALEIGDLKPFVVSHAPSEVLFRSVPVDFIVIRNSSFVAC